MNLRRSSAVSAVLALVAFMLAWGSVSAQAGSVPYTDQNATGFVALCSRSGAPVMGGRITDKPFVWRAISSVPPPTGYGVAGAKATLVIVQPRPHTYPDAWNGDTMTSSSPFQTLKHPTAAASALDFSLADFLREYKPVWNGMLQLRIYVGAPGQDTWSSTYPATDIQVTGSTWRVVRGGTLPCSSGAAQVNEPGKADKSGNALTPAGGAAHSSPKPGSTPSGRSTAAASGAPTSGSTKAATGSNGGSVPEGSLAAASTGASASPAWPWAVVPLVIVALVGGVGWFAFRRRDAAPTGRHS